MRALTVVLALTGSLLAATPAQAATRCEELVVPVAARPGAPATDRVAGTLCAPSRPAREIQVLVHGGTYDRRYWELRGPSTGPSYVESMGRAGVATFTLDRIGVSASSRPTTIDFDTQVHTLHQVVQHLRQRRVADRIVGVGHSFGSTILRKLAVEHPAAVDALVLTGEASSGEGEIDWPRYIHPATEDPFLRGYDERYYTTRPGRRAELFAYAPGADPVALLRDELTKQADVDSGSWLPPEVNARITVPVLVIVGAHDRLLCGAGACADSATLQRLEQRWYPRTTVRAVVIPDTGHSITVHRGLRQLTAAALG